MAVMAGPPGRYGGGAVAPNTAVGRVIAETAANAKGDGAGHARTHAEAARRIEMREGIKATRRRGKLQAESLLVLETRNLPRRWDDLSCAEPLTHRDFACGSLTRRRFAKTGGLLRTARDVPSSRPNRALRTGLACEMTGAV